MPSSGIAYCGAYHGVVLIMQVSARTVTANDETKRAIEAVFRIEYARLVAGLTRLVRDIGFAEEIGTARARKDLPAAAQAYVEFIENTVGVPADIVSVGADRAQTIIAGGAT